MRSTQMAAVSTSGWKGLGAILVAGCICMTGCKSWLDQSELVRARGARLVVPILDRIDPIDEAETEFQGAHDVRPGDLKVVPTDYVIGRNDLISVSIFDLTVGGVESVRTARVSETGLLMLPMLNEPIKAAGLTEQQLQKLIIQKYREAEILQNARVTVTVVEARGRTFTITGGVARPGQYVILESDFRMLNALVQAGDTTSPAENIYVIRRIASETPSTQPSEAGPSATPATPPALVPPTQPTIDPLAPRSLGPSPWAPLLAAEAPATQPVPGGDEKIIFVDGKPVVIGATRPATTMDVLVKREIPATQPVAEAATQPAYEFGAGMKGDEDQRVIRVPLQQLKNGDLRYNIVIRPNDLIVIPVPVVGYYYMGGHVGAPGAYNLTGQKITLKQAIVAARMLDSQAVPYRTDVVRRVGANELFVRVDLGKIFEGRQPDLYLKPNDTVLVGTDFYVPFLQALRGAFRATYGFGFLYDRNYAPAQQQTGG